ncbi:glycosyltransferase, partial [Pseudoalteromonas marina]|nr:glycosyltransferase [Pseudoalteromonas marina]
IQKKKVLWWGHGESKVPSLFTKLTIAAGKYLPDSVIVYMDNTKRSLVAENKYKDDKTFVAKNGIDVKTIRHAISKIETKRRSNWGTAYSGRLNEGRDLERIVHSISHLNKKGIECKHFFIGEGNARVKLEKLAEQLGVADKIVFCGAVHCADDLAAIYAQVDLVVIPGWLGLVIHQAFAFAKPVLICDKKELHNPEIALFDKTNGWVYSHEADDLAETLETVFELGKETINSKGDNCQQLVINEYSTQKMVDGLIEAIHYG